MYTSTAIFREMGSMMRDVLPDKLQQSVFHGILLAMIVMAFWLLDSLKDPILAIFVGMENQPVAKLMSVVTTLVLVCFYDVLTSMVSKVSLFHILTFSFGVIFLLFSGLVSNPSYGISNKNKNVNRYIGWFFYFSVEAFGSLTVALFWSYTNSIMNLEEAKGSYGFIIAIAQIGAVLGATLAVHANDIGVSNLILLGSMLILSVSLFVKFYHVLFNISESQFVKVKVKKNKSSSLFSLSSLLVLFEGFFEGFMIIIKNGYVIKLLLLSCLFEVVVTILDYEFKLRSSESVLEVVDILVDANNDKYESRFANLMGHFGQFTNILSFLISTFGFSLLVRRLGIRYTLLVFPFVLLTATVVANITPTLPVLFILVSTLKALIFSLNEPVKELLYIPTSDEIKFKAKAWIDVFGSRLAKAAGSFLTNQANGNVIVLRSIAEVPCLVLSIILIVVAWNVGIDFQNYVDSGIVVGESAKKVNIVKEFNENHYSNDDEKTLLNNDENELESGSAD